MPQARKSGATASTPDKTCFVVAEFGTTSESKKRSEQTLRHLIRAILEPRGYDVVRADDIHAPGLITHQIIEHLLDDDLVVADLTGNNPNVFYEMAVRHAAAKPIIHILTDGEKIPFDVKDVRTVYYALDDPDRLEDARQLFESAVVEIEKAPDEGRNNPISVVRHLRLLEASDDPEAVEMGEVLSAIKDIRDQLRSATSGPSGAVFMVPPPLGSVRDRIFKVIDNSKELISAEEVAERLGIKADTVARTLQRMQRDKQIYYFTDNRGSGWSTIPF
jgi:hypothetical protein